MRSIKKATPSYNWGISKTKRAPGNTNPGGLITAGKLAAEKDED